MKRTRQAPRTRQRQAASLPRNTRADTLRRRVPAGLRKHSFEVAKNPQTVFARIGYPRTLLHPFSGWIVLSGLIRLAFSSKASRDSG